MLALDPSNRVPDNPAKLPAEAAGASEEPEAVGADPTDKRANRSATEATGASSVTEDVSREPLNVTGPSSLYDGDG